MTAPASLTLPPTQPGAKVMGLGVYRPTRVVTNAGICQIIDSTDEWIRERSGVIERRFAGPDELPVDMGAAAGQQAIDAAGLAVSDIDVVIVATISHMLQTPAAAPMIADRLGATPAAAFDLSAACAGFCHGIGLANDLIRGGSAQHILVIGVEKMTDIIDPQDRSSSFIFADGSGAVVLGPSPQPLVGPTIWGSDGSGFNLIVQEEPWTVLRQSEGRDELTWPTVRMAGQSVFRWAVWQMAPVARKAVEAAGITLDDLGAFIPHQANKRIVDAMVKQLRLPAHVVVSHDIQYNGNTSSASIPLAMSSLLADHPELSGQYALLIGFGAGLSYAAQVVRLP